MRKQRGAFGQAGAILVEALLGLAITIIIITGLVVALNSSVSNSTFSTNQSQASLIAKEGLDLVKNIKEADYSSISGKDTGFYCLNDSQALVSNCKQNVTADNITFSRQLYINQNGQDGRLGAGRPVACNNGEASIFVASIVSWWDSKCGSNTNIKCHKIELSSCLTDLSKI